jgi:hypothetical protein
MLLPARYRQLHGPLLRLVEILDSEAPERTVTILIPETVKSAGGSTCSTATAPVGCGGSC